MRYDRTIIGYHGCSIKTAERILNGEPFEPSCNEYDWLGEGIYFWEYGFDRAWRWARHWYRSDGAVVGAIIQLAHCFDLTDTQYTHELAELAGTFVRGVKQARMRVPRNRGRHDLKGRFLDCAIINWALREMEADGTHYYSVRCLFTEGDPVYKDARVRTAITLESHAQVAVRDPACLIGVFRPSEKISRRTVAAASRRSRRSPRR